MHLILTICQKSIESILRVRKLLTFCYMLKKISHFFSAAFCALMIAALPIFSAPTQSITQWEPREGDIFQVDVTTNTGYLVHPDGTQIAFDVATGQQRNVYYLGRYYFAATPVASWTVNSSHIQPDRYTFGPKGKFLRLYKDGDQYTSYGIHTHKYIDYMLDSPAASRYRSMGCILVSDKMMEVLMDTFENNGNTLQVTTYAS